MYNTFLSDTVSIPESLILTDELTDTAKVMWGALTYDRKHGVAKLYSPARLMKRLGFSKGTITNGLKALIKLVWYTKDDSKPLPKLRGSRVIMSINLLISRLFSASAKVIYGGLQIPGVTDNLKQFMYSALSIKLKFDVKTIKKGIEQLTEAGWMMITRLNQLKPISYVIIDPIKERFASMLSDIKARLRVKEYPDEEPQRIGERLAGEWLCALVDTDEFVDGGYLGILRNAETGCYLSADRDYYKHKVIIEVNGSQHYVETECFKGSLADQQKRDALKKRLLEEKGIKLITIQPADLTYENMLRLIGDSLPLRDLTGAKELIEFLEWRSKRYRANCPQERY